MPGDKSFCVAAIQMVSGTSLEMNLARAGELVADAAAQGARMALLPEYFCFMGRRDRDKLAIQEAHGDGPIQEFLAQTARRHGIWLLGGSLPLQSRDTDRIYNAMLVFGPDGQAVARYDKIHLFGFRKGDESYDESISIRPGADQARVFDAPFGRVGLSICYDLRFPELYRAMGEVALIVVPAAFTYTTGSAHWEILLRARAIENQAFVVAPNQCGVNPCTNIVSHGHSMVIGPWGAVLARAGDEERVLRITLDPADLARTRSRIPVLQHRRL